MFYESSYETGHQPFVPDLKRGYWSSANDFIYAGLSLGFRLDVFALSWVASVESGVSGFIPTYLISMALYVVPLLVVKSFMGQFSSSGFISSLRLCPLFKGVGFVTLLLNMCVLIYYSIFAMIPIVYLIASLNPTLPWSCDGAREWTRNFLWMCIIVARNLGYHGLRKANPIINTWNRFQPARSRLPTIGSFAAISLASWSAFRMSLAFEFLVFGVTIRLIDAQQTISPTSQCCFEAQVASNMYFNNLFENYTIFGVTFSLSWHLVLSTLGVWAIITLIVYKLSTEKIGLLVRYSVWFLIAVLLILIGRLSLFPSTSLHYESIFTLNLESFVKEIVHIPAYSICAFGPGWGLFISLASFNRFKTNITRSSWLIGIGQMFVIFGLDILEKSIHLFYDSSSPNSYYRQHTQFRTLFMSSGSVLATMAWPNLWCILFYLMLSIASMVLMILQLHSILTSIFDEFVSLRQHRNRISFTIIAIMAVFSLYFATKTGFDSSIDLILVTVIGQSLVNLLLILVVTWIYGRIRFQRDMSFMTGTHFATWKIYILRFFAPLCMMVVLLAAIVMSVFHSFYIRGFAYSAFNAVLKTLPLWAIPSYIIYCLYRSQGSLKERFIKCCRPTDWYPVEAAERQRYEEVLNISNMTHPLSEMTWDAEEYDYMVNA